MIPCLALLAQETTQPGGGGKTFWIGIILMIAVFYFVLWRGNPKGKKQREQMMSGLKKNDRVMTIGGILGSVVAVKDKEVVIKVDETTNTKMTFIKDAIRTVVQDDTTLTVEDR
ncbi:MAG: preprotein translocase subunit YajC [bacterium]|nr:preprotein translocase subunit YajC [bacterium]